MTTPENQAEREKIADAIDPRKAVPFGQSWHLTHWHPAQSDLIAASDALRAARPTDAHRRAAEKIDALCYRAACIGWNPRGVEWVQQHDQIACILAEHFPHAPTDPNILTLAREALVDFKGDGRAYEALKAVVEGGAPGGSGWREIGTEAAEEISRRVNVLGDTLDANDIAAIIGNRTAAHMSGALADVAAERLRQVEVEGWDSEHDDDHDKGELAQAAGCYAWYAHRQRKPVSPWRWPFNLSWWKPKDQRRDLVRAGALIIAEIERIDRLDFPSSRRGGEG